MRLKFFSVRGEHGIPDGLLEIVLWGVIGGSFGSTALSFVGATASVAIVAGLVSAAGAAAIAHAWREATTRAQLEKLLETARREMIDLVERQARADAKMAEIERRTIESPALVWRAATEDIEALSALVSKLAAATAEHDHRLAAVIAAQAARDAQPRQAVSAPALAPHFAPLPAEIEAPAEPAAPEAPPAVIAELKTTLPRASRARARRSSSIGSSCPGVAAAAWHSRHRASARCDRADRRDATTRRPRRSPRPSNRARRMPTAGAGPRRVSSWLLRAAACCPSRLCASPTRSLQSAHSA